MLKIAACQFDISLGKVKDNFARVVELYSSSANQGAELVVFPECSLSGYCFDSKKEAQQSAVSYSDQLWQELLARCNSFNSFCICGFLEKNKCVPVTTRGFLNQ